MPKTSAELITQMFKAFARKDPKTYSKRYVSSLLHGNDPSMLTRWTGEDKRIPLSRVYELCTLLEASEDQRDRLMEIRIQESIAYEKNVEVMAVVEWQREKLEQWIRSERLDDVKEQVVAALHRAKAKKPLLDQLSCRLGLENMLEEKISQWLDAAINDAADQEIKDRDADNALLAVAMEANPNYEVDFKEKKKKVIGALEKGMKALKLPKVDPSESLQEKAQRLVKESYKKMRTTREDYKNNLLQAEDS